MKRLGRAFIAALGLGTVAFALSLVPQKTASGTVAANVNVVNTTANPVPTVGTDNAALNAFEGVGNCTGAFGCSMEVFAVPAGNVAVIDSVTGACFQGSTVNAVTSINMSFTPPGGVSANNLLLFTPPPAPSAFQAQNFYQNTVAYAAPGPIVLSIGVIAVQGSGFNCEVAVAGHLVRK
jgi:hypothetical protein